MTFAMKCSKGHSYIAPDIVELPSGVTACPVCRTMKRNHYADAPALQSASNVSGVAHSLAECCSNLIENGEFNLEKNPAVVLMVTQLHFLTFGGIVDPEIYGKAYRACQEKAKE